MIFRGNNSVFCKICDFICRSLRFAETVLDKRQRVQYGFCRTKTSANKIQYFTKKCKMTFLLYIHIYDCQSNLAAARQNQQNEQCIQQRLRSAWVSPPSLIRDFCCPHQETLGPELPTERTVKIRLRLGTLDVLSLLQLLFIKYSFFGSNDMYNFIQLS